MNRFLKRTLIVAIALAGIIASVLGTRELERAVAACRSLYQIDIIGSQIESDLEYLTQESRRAFLYALAVADPNEQLPYIDEARQASARVDSAVEHLQGLMAPEIDLYVDDFERSWMQYGQTRDQILARILEGDAASAVRVEKTEGQTRFSAALESLHMLKATLERHAGSVSSQVNDTLWRCTVGLAAFTLCTFLIMGLLGKLNRDRRLALQEVHASNAALEKAKEQERQRASILEMVSTHGALPGTLTAIAGLAPHANAQAGVAIWTAAGNDLQHQACANIPARLVESFELYPPHSDPTSAGIAEFSRSSCERAKAAGLAAGEPRVLQDAAGRLIGVLQSFAADPAVLSSPALLDQMAQLATMAIENTLLYERLAFQAQHDTLTQLPNRLLFVDRVQQATRLAARHHTKAGIAWIDLDRYKQINDTLGHRLGDEVLCEVARRLKNCLRTSDTVARVGGDEFTVLLQDLGSIPDVEVVCSKIMRALSSRMTLGDHEVAITASAGISIFPDDGEDTVVLLRNADLAMYSAKRAGGNTYRLFQPAFSESMQRRVQIEQELKTALELEEFHLQYQPLLRRNGQLEALEVLLRWNNPALGSVSPADFIPIAEEMGLILPIGEWVMRKALSEAADWLRSGYDVPRIAVNVSALQFVEKSFAEMIGRALNDFQFPPAKLELEITETALMNNLEQGIEHMDSLRRTGIRFAIDDFGTGYSSLSQLRVLPVDCVKIDRSFIKDLEHGGSGCTTLVRGIIALAHNLQLEVVAEGVETEAQLSLLRTLGCDINQGFFLHRPMPAEAVMRLLPQNRQAPLPDLSDSVPGRDILLPSAAGAA